MISEPNAGIAVHERTTASPIVKPLPPELFVVHDTNAEMRWEAMRGQGYHTPTDRFFVRNHTRTPLIDPVTWQLRLHGTGLRAPRAFTYEDLLALPIGILVGVILGALGGGGAIVAVPALVYLLDQPPHAATTASLVIVIISASAGVIGHWRAGRVRVGSAVAFAAAGLVGAAVTIGGSVGARPDFADKVARVLLRLAPRPVEIRTSTLGKRAGVVGAMSVALSRLHDELFGVAELAATLLLPPPRAS